MADEKIASLEQFFIILTVVIFNFIHIEECFALKLAILCQKKTGKKDVDFRRTGTLIPHGVGKLPRVTVNMEREVQLDACISNVLAKFKSVAGLNFELKKEQET